MSFDFETKISAKLINEKIVVINPKMQKILTERGFGESEKDTLILIKEILKKYKGGNETFVELLFPSNKVRKLSVDGGLKIKPCDEIIQEVEAVLGKHSIRFE